MEEALSSLSSSSSPPGWILLPSTGCPAAFYSFTSTCVILVLHCCHTSSPFGLLVSTM